MCSVAPRTRNIRQPWYKWLCTEPWDVVVLKSVCKYIGGCPHTKILTFPIVSTSVYRLIFTKLSANIPVEQLVGFITVYSNCDGSLKGRCYGNRFVSRVGENWHTPSSFCVLVFDNCWEDRKTNERPLRPVKYSWTLVGLVQ